MKYATLNESFDYLPPISEKIYGLHLAFAESDEPVVQPGRFKFESVPTLQEILKEAPGLVQERAGRLLCCFTNLLIKQKNQLTRKICTTTQQV